MSILGSIYSEYSLPVNLTINQQDPIVAMRYVRRKLHPSAYLDGVKIEFSDAIDVNALLIAVFRYTKPTKATTLNLVLASGEKRAEPYARFSELAVLFPEIQMLTIRGEIEYDNIQEFLDQVNRHFPRLTFLHTDAVTSMSDGTETRAHLARFVRERAENPRCKPIKTIQVHPVAWPVSAGDPLVTACAKHGCRLTKMTPSGMVESRLVYEATVCYRKKDDPLVNVLAGIDGLSVAEIPEMIRDFAFGHDDGDPSFGYSQRHPFDD